MLPEGAEGHIEGINAGRGLWRRLVEMGFTENARVKVIRSQGGPLIVEVAGSRYAIGQGMAMKIMIR